MDLSKIRSASFESKSKLNLPEGATVTDKSYSLTVREIMNGFIVCKSWSIQYTQGEEGYTDSTWYEEQYYSKTNPMKIDFKEKSIADKL